MADVNLQPLFDYMDDKFAIMDSRLSKVEGKLDTLQTSVDNLTKTVKDFQDEHIILHRRVELLETWAREVSKKVGIPLPQGIISS